MSKVHYTDRLDEILESLFDEKLSDKEFDRIAKKAKIVIEVSKVQVSHDANKINALKILSDTGYLNNGGKELTTLVNNVISKE